MRASGILFITAGISSKSKCPPHVPCSARCRSLARLSAQAVAVIVKNAARMVGIKEKAVAQLSGHSLHKSPATVRGYIRTQGRTQAQATDSVLAD